jgi:putative sterol carrier protein
VSSAKEYFAGMPAAFSPTAAAGLSASYQFELSGDGGGQWFVRVRNGKLEVGEGVEGQPDVVICATAADYVAIAEGTKSPTWALLTGRFKVSGSMRLAMKLEKIFPR